MSAGKAKVELLLELRNKLKSGLGTAKDQLSRGVSSMKMKLNELKSSHIEAFSAMKDEIPGLDKAIGLLTNPYALATAAVVALGAAYYKAVNMAADWEKGMAKVNVTAQLSKKELASLSSEVLRIGANNTMPLEEVPEAFNKIVSAGLDLKTSLQAFDPILKAAKAGFTDVETVAAATVATMNSTGIKDATVVLDTLFATMNKGNAEFADIANYLPKIIPGAQAAGVSFQDTAGAFAYLTAQGWKAEAAATGLQNVFKAISNPKTVDGFKKIGINVYDANGKMKPMLTIVKDLKTGLHGLTDEQRNLKLDKVGLDTEARDTLFSLMANYGKLKDTIDFTNASQGQLNEAVKNAETPMDVWILVSQQVKKEMIEIGKTGLPIIKTIGLHVLNTINYFKNLYKESMLFRDIISAIGVAFEVAFKIATAAITTVWNYLKILWGTIVSIKEAIFGAGDGFEQWYLKIKPYILWVYQYLAGIAKVAFSIATLDFNGLKEGAKALANGKGIDDIRKEVKKEYDDRKNIPKIEPKALVPPTGTTGKTTGGTGKQKKTKNGDVDKVTGSQQQVRNITINMDAMVKNIDFSSTSPQMAGMSKKELEQWFTELCFRMLRNIETSYS